MCVCARVCVFPCVGMCVPVCACVLVSLHVCVSVIEGWLNDKKGKKEESNNYVDGDEWCMLCNQGDLIWSII